MEYELIIRNGTVVTEDGAKALDVYVADGVITKLVESGAEEDSAVRVIDAKGKFVFPGFVDAHVHLNDPGLTNSEDFYTGTSAAAAGGITTVLEHPLTNPLPDNLEAFEQKKAIGKSKVVTDFGLFGACSDHNEEEMLKMIDAGAVAFKTFLPYSSEIPSLDDGQILDRMAFLADKDIVLAIHCENNDIVEHYTKKMREEGHVKHTDYPKGRPDIAELEAVQRMCLFAEKTGAKINIAHTTLAEAVGFVRDADERGANITVETCPQYLTLDETCLADLGVFGICNPPLRSKEEVEKMWECLLAGDIDWVCSDHSTYTIEEKMVGKDDCFLTPAGVTSIELGYQLLFSEGVQKRGLPVEQFAQLSSTNAAKRYRLYPKKGTIAVGSDGDFAIIDPEMTWTVDDQKLKQMIKWSAYPGKEISGKVVSTILRGHEIYDGEDIVAEKGSGEFLAPLPEAE